jgi:hypothetical protein
MSIFPLHLSGNERISFKLYLYRMHDWGISAIIRIKKDPVLNPLIFCKIFNFAPRRRIIGVVSIRANPPLFIEFIN